MGRKSSHNPNKNIINIVTKSKWRTGYCTVCQRSGIRSCQWKDHIHQHDHQNFDHMRLNQSFIDRLIQQTIPFIREFGMNYLNHHYPRGAKIAYLNPYQKRLLEFIGLALSEPINAEELNDGLQHGLDQGYDPTIYASDLESQRQVNDV